MKKSILLGIATLGLLGLIGTGIGINGQAVAETKADGGVVSGGDTVYLRLSSSYWGQGDSTFAIYSWGKGTASYTPMTKVSDTVSTVYKVTIPEGDSSIIFVRYSKGSSMTSWDGRQNQSCDISLSSSTSNIWVNSSWGKDSGGNGGDWGGNWATGTYSEEAEDLSLTIYAGKTSAPTYCYAWGETGPLTAAYPGDPMATPAKPTVYQGATLYRATINYSSHMSDHSDVTIKMILNNGGDSDKSANIDVVLDGHYYSPNGVNWYSAAPIADENKGFDAKIAWDLATTDICNLTSAKADDLRDEMDTNKGYVTSATWDGYSYASAYELVDGKCTTPKAVGSVSVLREQDNSNTMPIIIVVVSIAALAGLASFVYLRKKRSEE